VASPAHRSDTTQFVFGGNPTSVTGTEPAGAASGDGLLLVALIDHSGATGSGAVNTPTGGWTLRNPGGTAILAGDFDIWVWTLRRGGSAPSYQVSWANGLDGFGYAEAHVIAASGIVASGEFVDDFQVAAAGTGTSVNPPAVTLGTIETLVYACGFSWAGWGSAPTLASYTVQIGGGAIDAAVGSRQVAGTGTEDPAAFSAADGSADFVAFTIAFRSVAAGVAADPPRRRSTSVRTEGVIERPPQRRPFSFAAFAAPPAQPDNPPPLRRRSLPAWAPGEIVRRRVVLPALLPRGDSPPGVLWDVISDRFVEVLPQRRRPLVRTASALAIETGLAAETDTALALQLTKLLATGLATGTETSLALALQKELAAQRADETDTAQAPTLTRSIATGVSTETDTALGGTLTKFLSPGVAVETDTAEAPTLASGFSVGLASETDTALALSLEKRIGTGVAVETDVALPLDLISGLAVGAALETDTALAPILTRELAAGTATETDSALAPPLARSLPTLPAVETSVALSLTLTKALTPGMAVEVDAALAPHFSLQVGVAIETDTALALAIGSGLPSAAPSTGEWIKAPTPSAGVWTKH
jgi:hypothetical protein